MRPINISFHREAKDLAITCDLDVWHRLPHRFGYHEKDSQEIQQGIKIHANVTVFCNVSGFPLEAAEFPHTTTRLEVSPAIVEVTGKQLRILIVDYEQRPLRLFKTGNHGLFVQHYGLRRENQLRFDLEAWISFHLPGPIRQDIKDPTLGTLGSQFESNRRRH
jgi:hypothetical protein